MRNKLFSKYLVLCMSFLLCTSCAIKLPTFSGSNSEENDQTNNDDFEGGFTDDDSHNKEKDRIDIYFDTSHMNYFEAIIDDFNHDPNQHFMIDTTSVGYQASDDFIDNYFDRSNIPDLFISSGNRILRIVDKGKVLDLKHADNGSNNLEQKLLLDHHSLEAKSYNYNNEDNLYSLPCYSESLCLYYDEHILDFSFPILGQPGYTYQFTKENLKHISGQYFFDTLLPSFRKYMIDMGFMSPNSISSLVIAENEAKLFNYLSINISQSYYNAKSHYDVYPGWLNQDVEEAMLCLTRAHANNLFKVGDYDGYYDFQNFINDSGCMFYIGSTNHCQDLMHTSLNVGITNLPIFGDYGKPYNCCMTEQIAVMKTGDHKKEQYAIDFLKYCYSETTLERYLKDTVGLPFTFYQLSCDDFRRTCNIPSTSQDITLSRKGEMYRFYKDSFTEFLPNRFYVDRFNTEHIALSIFQDCFSKHINGLEDIDKIFQEKAFVFY